MKADGVTTPVVYIIGSVHNMHFNTDNNYSIQDLLAQIKALKPDVVCGEIAPEYYEGVMEGYFPPEAAFLAQMASTAEYRFEPVDWRLDYATQSKADSEYPSLIKEQTKAIMERSMSLQKKFGNLSVYDYLHNPLNLTLIDSLYEQVIGANHIAEIAAGNWHERNRHIVENGLAVSKNAHTIVFVFGVDHIPQIKRQLKIKGIEAQVPKRMFVPGGNLKLANDEVLIRWKRNLENLKLIRDRKKEVSIDSFQKVINSKRIQNLEEAIQKSS